MAETWKINPKTGDYIMENGSPVPTERLLEPAYYRLKASRGKWMYAPNNRWGSDYYLARRRFNGGDLSPLANIGDRALAPLVEDGRARSAVVSFDTEQQVSRHNAALVADLIDDQGQAEKLELPIIRV